jgi:WD40 repeat protein
LRHVDLATGRRTDGPDLGLDGVTAIAVSPDGTQLYAADGTDALVVWDSERERIVQRLPAERVTQIAVAPGGERLVTLTAEGIMSLWDLPSATRLGEIVLRERELGYSPDAGAETTIRFTADGDVMYSATLAGSLLRWDMTERAWADAVCEITRRSLTVDEWSRYIGDDQEPTFACES